jgi:hypothetical protein
MLKSPRTVGATFRIGATSKKKSTGRLFNPKS